MTAHIKKMQLLPLQGHIDLVHVEFPMEDLASVTEDSSQGDRLNQSKKAPIAET